VSKLHAPICQNEIQSLEEDTTSFFVPNVLQRLIKCASSTTMVQTFRAQSRRCHGFGHVQDVCTSPRAYILQDDGGYTSASDVEDMDENVVIGDPFDNNDMDYVLENEEDPSSCEISKPATRSAPTISENEIKGNEKGVTLGQGENSFDEPNFFTDHANVEQLVVESFNFLPLSRDDFLVVPCDKKCCVKLIHLVLCHN
jgi:hypothetical protein